MDHYPVLIGNVRNLLPQGGHKILVVVHAVLLDGSLALNHGGTDGHALKVLVVQEAVVVNVCGRIGQ